ncbi:MAG: amidohydrolase [Acidobacteria bacterium]|nr:amidohydrolase [Acidobacteriota bacterium]
MKIFDVHVHINPWRMFKPPALETFFMGKDNREHLKACMDDPAYFLRYMDSQEVERAGLINYVSDIIGFTSETNDFVSKYCQADPRRLIAFGSVHPGTCPDVEKEMARLLHRLRIRAIKIHPPHQEFAANAYRHGLDALATVYRICEQEGVPLMIHTGTSIFPGVRNVYADPLPCDDVAVDFPNLKLILAHGGRPIWMDTVFFLLRRHKNVWLDISGIPPQSLLKYFPRFEMIGPKALFGTDWPSPGVRQISESVRRFRALSLPVELQKKILFENANSLFQD